jgi:ribosomal protein S18 acetylase RimI-like enzyme
MSASAVASENSTTGIRGVNVRTDLAAIADLIDICFGARMDDAGRATVRELRALSQAGPMLALLNRFDRLLDGIGHGYVYTEAGRIVANVSIARAGYPRSMGVGALIANVATHPDYRRRGLARALMEAALDGIRAKGMDFAILQVEADNYGARALYRQLGFSEERTFIRWVRPPYTRTPLPKSDGEGPYITLRSAHEWREEYELACLVRPNRRGGVAWQRPTHPDLFRPSFWQALGRALSGQSSERWVARREDGTGIAAALHVMTHFGSTTRLELLVHPNYRGKVESALFGAALYHHVDRYRTLNMEHPADDESVSELLESLGFERRNVLVHMRLDLGTLTP